MLDNNNNLKKKKKNEAQLVLESSEKHVGQTLQAPLEGSLPAVQSKWQEGLGLSRECMFLGSLSRHDKDLERWTLKPLVCHSSRVLDRPCYSSQVSNGPCYSS